jgi:hypothetical protein
VAQVAASARRDAARTCRASVRLRARSRWLRARSRAFVLESQVKRARMAELRALDGCWPRWSLPDEELLLVLVPCQEGPDSTDV